jgi:hypothetical protein
MGMATPKPKGGRPRRRPFAAHDARAVRIRARNAIYWLDQFRWCLDGHPEVLAYFRQGRPEGYEFWRANESVVRGVLRVLDRDLQDPVAPEGEVAGDGD